MSFKSIFKISPLFIFILLFCFINISCDNGKRKGDPKVLVFSKTSGFVHESIPDGIAAIVNLGSQNGFSVDTTTNADLFEEENLSKYSTVVFLNTTGDVFNHYQEAAFERYIQAGGGFVGIHSATDTEYGWGWYGKLVGGYFKSHPKIQEARFKVRDHECDACNFIENEIWTRTDELYNFKNMNEDVNVILTVDEGSYEGGENGENHPMSWYHEYDGGRAFYTALGHTKESYSEENYLNHILAGIKYAIGQNLKLNYAKAKTQIPPDGDRFSKKQLISGGFFEPTEMAVLPNRDVLIGQRRGEIYLYKHESEELSQVAFLDVYHSATVENVNAEEGLMGLQKDPDYANNNWVYVFYSPKGDEWVNRLSRFKFVNDQFDLQSEQVILDVESQREICCHTGGSIAFDSNGLLYLSTGDNSTPFDEPKAKFVNNGYAPLNDLPGKEQYDARRSSGNTNDLRGKIIRIKVNEDGSYDIPEGNLFPVGTEKTRPEIYTMGHRNPYRISVDPKNGYVYWGDVGPDARADDFEKRGPRGYDEMNQARQAGNFGWPLFIADNKAYFDYDYATGKSGVQFDPKAPINDSKNNNGLTELPPAQGAYVFYHYGNNDQITELESGGRNAMAGPAYYTDLFKGNNKNKLPDYYNGKVIIYDWIRGWMKAVTLFPDGTFNKLEPFAPHVEVNNLIDMEVAEDGTIYLLEYGTTWFAKNDDSGLGYIEYNGGNRPPVIKDFNVDKTSGPAPLTVSLTADAHDREKDNIKFRWDFGNDEIIETEESKITHTFEDEGEHKITVEVVDDKSASAKSKVITVVAGNTRPEIAIDLNGGNSSFYIPGLPINYAVSISDPEDGDGGIDGSKFHLAVDYLDGFDEASLTVGHQQISLVAQGENLTNSLDCRACHKVAEKSIGPSYSEIAEKYKEDKNAISYLQTKIIEGGSGVWGEVVMAAHPNLSKEEANQMALFILSLAEENNKKAYPMAGQITPDKSAAGKVMVLTASYTDKGGENSIPLTGIKTLALKSSTVPLGESVTSEGFRAIKFGDREMLISSKDGGWFAMENVDLKGIKSATITGGWREAPEVGMELELRLDSPDGQLIGKGKMPKPKKGSRGGQIPIQFNKPYDQMAGKLYFVYNPEEKDKSEQTVALFSVDFGAL